VRNKTGYGITRIIGTNIIIISIHRRTSGANTGLAGFGAVTQIGIGARGAVCHGDMLNNASGGITRIGGT